MPQLEFQAAMAGLKETDVPYLYINRTKPEVKKEQSGRQYNYVEKIEHPLPADIYGHVKSLHGGGEYQLLLNAKARTPNCVAEMILDIPISEADPILDIRELVRGKPLAEQLIRRWKKDGKVQEVDGELFAVVPGQGPTGQQQTGGSSAIADKIMSKAVDKMFDEPKASSGAELIAAMREGREQAKELIEAAAGKGGDSSMVTFLMSRIDNMEKSNLAMQERLFEAMTKKPAESSNLDTAFQLFDKVSEKFGTGGQRSIVGEIGEAIGKFGPPLIGAIMMFRGGGMPAALPAAASPQPGGGAAPAAAPQQDPTMQRNIDQVRKLGRRVIVAIDQDKAGGDFAQSFVDMEGEEMYGAMVQAGVPTLIATLRTLPDLALEFDKEPRPEKLNKFLQEFIAWANEDAPEEVTA